MIEQILAFVLGAGSVFLIWGVVLAFRTSRKLKQLQDELQDELPNIYDGIDTHSDELHRRIDEVINRTEELLKESIKHTDSRVDKLESKTDLKFNDVMENDHELRQRINNTAELINDIAGLNIKK
jgi:methyl-accepting chemotaxis protein